MILLEFEIKVFTILMQIIIVEVIKLFPIFIMIEGVTILTIRMKLKLLIIVTII